MKKMNKPTLILLTSILAVTAIGGGTLAWYMIEQKRSMEIVPGFISDQDLKLEKYNRTSGVWETYVADSTTSDEIGDIDNLFDVHLDTEYYRMSTLTTPVPGFKYIYSLTNSVTTYTSRTEGSIPVTFTSDHSNIAIYDIKYLEYAADVEFTDFVTQLANTTNATTLNVLSQAAFTALTDYTDIMYFSLTPNASGIADIIAEGMSGEGALTEGIINFKFTYQVEVRS